jgi:hypothetical protein
MTLGRNAAGYLTESLHGAGSPQAQRIQILRQMEVERKKDYAKDLAGIDEDGGDAIARLKGTTRVTGVGPWAGSYPRILVLAAATDRHAFSLGIPVMRMPVSVTP